MDDRIITKLINVIRRFPYCLRKPVYVLIGLISRGGGMTYEEAFYSTM